MRKIGLFLTTITALLLSGCMYGPEVDEANSKASIERLQEAKFPVYSLEGYDDPANLISWFPSSAVFPKIATQFTSGAFYNGHEVAVITSPVGALEDCVPTGWSDPPDYLPAEIDSLRTVCKELPGTGVTVQYNWLRYVTINGSSSPAKPVLDSWEVQYPDPTNQSVISLFFRSTGQETLDEVQERTLDAMSAVTRVDPDVYPEDLLVGPMSM